MPPAPAPAHVPRGAAVAGVGLALAGAAHGLASGSAPEVGPLPLLVAALLVAGLVVASARRWTPARLVGALALVQVAVHGALWLGSGSGTLDPRLSGVAAAHGAVVGHVHAAGGSPSAVMLAAHVGAVVVAALLLARVDDAVALLVSLARRWARPVAAVHLPAPVRATAPSVVRRVPASALLATRLLRRGPPARPATG